MVFGFGMCALRVHSSPLGKTSFRGASYFRGCALRCDSLSLWDKFHCGCNSLTGVSPLKSCNPMKGILKGFHNTAKGNALESCEGQR